MKAIAALLLAAVIAAGCGSVEPHLVPTPAVLKDPRMDISSRIPEALRTTSQPVFYATTRAQAAEGHYGNADGGGVMLGVATVRLGDPGMSWDELMASHRTSSVDRPRPGAVESIEEFGRANRVGNLEEAERHFIAAIDKQIEKTRNRELIVYVHGYRVAFDEVAVQMGSFSHYLGQGATVTFQWPTGSMFWNYLTDCPRAERYIPDIERLLVLAGRTKAEYINVMAYSCGSPLLAAAVARLRQRDPLLGHGELQRKYRLGSVIFAASDVDLKTFAQEYVAPALDVSKQVVIYFSQLDRALGFSTLVSGASRLGRPDLTVLSVQDLQRMDNPRLVAVNVTQVRGAHEMGGMKGHGYWYANEVISSDVSLSLRYPIPPARRCLENEPPGSRVWRIPEGYVDCVTTRLLEAFPELRSSSTTPRQ
ncbi:MAG: alpha/beta hydrolase [Variovorax sp.]|nr:MAG: alpha/beta hydrolase [Variovorax sp.]